MNPPTHMNCVKTIPAHFVFAGAMILIGCGFAAAALVPLKDELWWRVMFLGSALPCLALGGYMVVRVPHRFCWDDAGFVNVRLFGWPGRRVAWSEVVALERSFAWFRARLSDGRCVHLDVNVVPEPQRYMDVLTTHLGHLIGAAVAAAEQRGEFALGSRSGIRWQPGGLEWGRSPSRTRVFFNSLHDVERRFEHNYGLPIGLRYHFQTLDGKSQTFEIDGEGFLVLDLLIQRSIPANVVLVDETRSDRAYKADAGELAATLRAAERETRRILLRMILAVAAFVSPVLLEVLLRDPTRVVDPLLAKLVAVSTLIVVLWYLPRVIENVRERRDLRQRLEKLGADPAPR